jgi:hypothetical protein
MDEGRPQKHSMLVAYFNLNKRDGDAASTHTYQTVGMDYWYDRTTDRWHKRTRKIHNHICQVGTVSARNKEAQVYQ